MVKSVIGRVRNRFNVSMAEVDFLDVYSHGRIGIAVVSNRKRHVNSILDNILNYIENSYLIDITNINMEII